MLYDYKSWSRLYEQRGAQNITLNVSKSDGGSAAYLEFVNRECLNILAELKKAVQSVITDVPDELTLSPIAYSDFDKFEGKSVALHDSYLYITGMASWTADGFFSDIIIDLDLNEKQAFRAESRSFDVILPTVEYYSLLMPNDIIHGLSLIHKAERPDENEIHFKYFVSSDMDPIDVLVDGLRESYKAKHADRSSYLKYTKYGGSHNTTRIGPDWNYEKVLASTASDVVRYNLLSGLFAGALEDNINKVIDNLVYNTDYFKRALLESHITMA